MSHISVRTQQWGHAAVGNNARKQHLKVNNQACSKWSSAAARHSISAATLTDRRFGGSQVAVSKLFILHQAEPKNIPKILSIRKNLSWAPLLCWSGWQCNGPAHAHLSLGSIRVFRVFFVFLASFFVVLEYLITMAKSRNQDPKTGKTINKVTSRKKRERKLCQPKKLCF